MMMMVVFLQSRKSVLCHDVVAYELFQRVKIKENAKKVCNYGQF